MRIITYEEYPEYESCAKLNKISFFPALLFISISLLTAKTLAKTGRRECVHY